MIHEQIIAAIEKLMQGILAENKLELPENVKIALEHPVSLEHGDYSSIAMHLAKLSPLEVWSARSGFSVQKDFGSPMVHSFERCEEENRPRR